MSLVAGILFCYVFVRNEAGHGRNQCPKTTKIGSDNKTFDIGGKCRK